MEIQLTLEEDDFNLWGTKETFEVDFVEICGEDYIHSLTHKGHELSPLIDKHTDYIWYLNQNSLNYKPRISTFWRQVHFHELNINSYRMINNIGSDYKNVYIDVGHSILVVNQLSGMLENNQEDYLDKHQNLKNQDHQY